MRSFKFFAALCAVTLAVASTEVARAQAGGEQTVPHQNPQPQTTLPASQAPVQQPNQSIDPLFVNDPLSPLFSPIDQFGHKLNDTAGLQFTAGYTFLYQNATEVSAGNRDLLMGRLDLGASWTFFQQNKDSGSLGFLLRSGENIGQDQRNNLNANVAAAQGINSLQGGGREEPVTVNLLYWRQSFLNNNLAFFIGKLHPNDHMDLSSVADDEAKQFLAGTFDGNATNPVEGAYTPGAAVDYQMTKTVHINAIIVDSLGEAQTGVSTLQHGKFFENVELGYQPEITGFGKGFYRVDGWHNEQENGINGWGIQAGFDQEIGGGWVPFCRWGIADRSASSVHQVVAGGIANITPFGRRDDMFGIACSWSEPDSPTFHQETLIETFYRIRLTNNLELSPDIEIVNHPANRVDTTTSVIFGIRLRVIF